MQKINYTQNVFDPLKNVLAKHSQERLELSILPNQITGKNANVHAISSTTNLKLRAIQSSAQSFGIWK